MASRIRVSRAPRRRTTPRRSPITWLINWIMTFLTIALVGSMLYLAWPLVRAQLSGVPITGARLAAPSSAPAIAPRDMSSSAPRQRQPPDAAAPAALPARNPGGSCNDPAAADAACATAVASTDTITPTATPAPCTLITWQDGSQSCDDGRAIDAAHSQPGYCLPVTWDDGSISCNDGKPSGKVVWPDPEVDAEPTNTPWPAAPTNDVQWSSADGPNGNTCITVTFGDGRQQTACSDPGVKLDSDDQAFVARLIQDGKIAPGSGAPKG